MTAYYNEHDPFAAAWLRNLIELEVIAPGMVDERSIEDVTPNDLRGFTQCHFFAGIGVWSYALRQAGWADDRPVGTGSCPCQPFSLAGKARGFDDERHLWPAWQWLIEQCGPAVVLGEQVASKDGLAWLDLVRADMEGTGRAFGAADLCAAGFGAPHIRQRLFWVAQGDPNDARLEGRRVLPERADQRAVGAVGLADGMADHHHHGRSVEPQCDGGTLRGRAVQSGADADGRDELCGLVNPGGSRIRDTRCGPNARETSTSKTLNRKWERIRVDLGDANDGRTLRTSKPGPTNGHWRDADWLFCRDGKWRPVESQSQPLAHGVTNRVGRLRGYGNAIVAQVAQGFIEAVMETIDA